MRVAPIALNALSPRLSTHALAFASSASHPSATRPLKRRRLATAASTMAPTPSSPRMQSAEVLFSSGLQPHKIRGSKPFNLGSVDVQVQRCLERVRAKSSDLERYEFLSALRATHTHLFYKLLTENLTELTPLVYTPTIGAACQQFSALFAHHDRGLYLSIEDKGHVKDILNAFPISDVDVSVLTDGSRILGLGDLGANGMGIPIGKLSLYVACAGIDPARTLPVMIDLGTNNEELLNDPLYVGLRRRRVPDSEGEEFVTEFLDALNARWPHAIAQFEDFHQPLCFDLLAHQREKRPCFNDDIQGTAAVSLACFISAIERSGVDVRAHRFVFFGAGSAAIGIAQLMCEHLVKAGLSEEDARERFWLVDSKGLVADNRGDKLPPHKVYFSRRNPQTPRLTSLQAVVEHVRPTGLLGLSTVGGSFTEEVLRTMGTFNDRPIVCPLSNPSDNSECTFEEAVKATDGRVLFASGSPFPPFTYRGKTLTPAQGNNSYVFPAIGLGSVLARVKTIPEELMHATAQGLAAALTDEQKAAGLILPPLGDIRKVTVKITRKFIRVAQSLGVDTNASLRDMSDAELEAFIAKSMYQPMQAPQANGANGSHL